MINEINNLSLIANEHEYNRETTYVTLGISGGICNSGLHETENNSFTYFNKSVPLIFSMMVKMLLKTNYRKRSKVKVNKTDFNITIKTNQRHYEDDIYELLSTIYSNDFFTEELFEIAKKNVLEDFTNKFSDIKFKAYLSMLEFTDNSKKFKFTDLAEDIKNCTFNNFQLIINKLINFKNSVLLINGQIKPDTEKFIQFVLDKKVKEQDIQLTYPVTDPFLETDMHMIQYDKSNLEMGALRFNFFEKNITSEEKYLLLNYIGMILFSNNFDVSVDNIDNSLLYMDAPLQEYKGKVVTLFDEIDFDKVKNDLVSINDKIILEKPYMFNDLLVSSIINKVDYVKYLDLLIESDKIFLQNLLFRSDLKITEAHLIFKEREVFVNGRR